MNIHKAIMELHDKSQMQQTIIDALKQLDEWEYSSDDVEAAKQLLRRESDRMEKEINGLQDYIAGGELDVEQALGNE